MKSCLAIGSLVTCLAMLPAYQAEASTLLVDEQFTHPDGPLDGLTPSPGPGGLWENHSGTAGTLPVVGGAALLTQDGGSGDSHTSFAALTTGVVTASFDIVVNAPAAMTGTDFEFFAHFWQSTATTAFRSRTDVVAPGAAGGDYSIGIATQASTAEVTLGDLVGFSFGQTVPVTITFDIDAGTSSLTAGGFTVNTAVVSLGQTIDAFALRQSTSSSLETIQVDNLVVTHVPEPASAALMVLGGAVIGRRRRG